MQEAGSRKDDRRPGIAPELVVADLEAAKALLVGRFGFSAATEASPDPALLECRLGSQRVLLRQDPTAEAGAHGVIDHVALKVGDADKALAQLAARGASLDSEVTPDGPKEIAEFWTAGVRYVFLQGPGGARLELCAKRDATEGLDGQVLGHDHVGVSCRDIPAMRTFFAGLGFQNLATYELRTESGPVDVCFMALGDGVVELYSLPEVRSGQVARAARGLWARLHVYLPDGRNALTFKEGPEGLDVVCWGSAS